MEVKLSLSTETHWRCVRVYVRMCVWPDGGKHKNCALLYGMYQLLSIPCWSGPTWINKYDNFSLRYTSDSSRLDPWPQEMPLSSCVFMLQIAIIIIFLNTAQPQEPFPYLGFRQKYLSLRHPFVWLQHSNTKGKQAVLQESLFKESQSWWVPPTPAPANRESAPSRTKTSQARPFLHTRQKNVQRRSLLLPPTLLRMFGKKAETTGTTIRLPYLEKMA